MSGIVYTPPPAIASQNLNSVMLNGNFTTVQYDGTGIALNTTVVQAGSYTPNNNDFFIVCDVSTGSVNINLPLSYYNVLAIKLINYTPGNVVRVRTNPPQLIDGDINYIITREQGSILVKRIDANNYAVLAMNDGKGSVNSGKHIDNAFTGNIITIPHNLNIPPTGITIEPLNSNTWQAFSGGYYISTTPTDIIIPIANTIVVPITLEISWCVTRN